MRNFPASPFEIFKTVFKNAELIQALTIREILGRYRGSLIGVAWSLITPIVMLGIYTFVFSVVFKARWSEQVSGGGSKIEFALILFVGLIAFNIFSECIGRAPSLVLVNSNYVKKVIFPLEILPLVYLGASLFHACISYCMFMVVYICFISHPPLTVVWMPAVLTPLVFYTLGFSWFLASLGVYIKDTSQFVGILTTVLMFLTPIFYPINALPERYQIWAYLNPLAATIEQLRQILIFGTSPNLIVLIMNLLGSILVCSLGFYWFQKTRKGFADVL
jgi:lipopolysaccharide transport system permease protein